MSISGISSNSSINQTSGIDGINQTSSSSIPPPMTSASGSSAQFSKPGELMGKLSSLEQSDPAKFKEVAGSIATELQTAAQSAQGGAASFLSTLASKFTQASQTGTMASLAPSGGANAGGPPPGGASGGAHGHHHHHHGGGGSGSSVSDALSAALDQVNQALNGTSTSSSSSTSATASASTDS